MRAVCVTPDRRLEVREIPAPAAPPVGHLLVDLAAATITHGDKFFLARPLPGATGFINGRQDVYGANGAGRVAAVGSGVPDSYRGKQVAIFKSLALSPETLGVWSERVLVHYRSCLVLPDDVQATDYSGSFANALTIHAFLAEAALDGHKAIIITAGASATGRIATWLAARQGIPAIVLVRSASSRDELQEAGVTYVINTAEGGFEAEVGTLAAALQATAVFDGAGGETLSRILPVLPINTAVYVYGLLAGLSPVSISTALILGKNLSLERFSVLNNATVSTPERLASAVDAIASVISDPVFRTKIGRTFSFDEINAAMAYEAGSGARALLIP